MKKPRLRLVAIYLLALMLGALLLVVSQEVQREQQRLAALEEQAVQQKEAMKFLRAEWAFLNNPERLERLAHQVLGLQPETPAQITDTPPQRQKSDEPGLQPAFFVSDPPGRSR